MSSENVFDVLVKAYQDLRRVQKKLDSISHLFNDLDSDSKVILNKILAIANEISNVGDDHEQKERNEKNEKK